MNVTQKGFKPEFSSSALNPPTQKDSKSNRLLSHGSPTRMPSLTFEDRVLRGANWVMKAHFPKIKENIQANPKMLQLDISSEELQNLKNCLTGNKLTDDELIGFVVGEKLIQNIPLLEEAIKVHIELFCKDSLSISGDLLTKTVDKFFKIAEIEIADLLENFREGFNEKLVQLIKNTK